MNGKKRIVMKILVACLVNTPGIIYATSQKSSTSRLETTHDKSKSKKYKSSKKRDHTSVRLNQSSEKIPHQQKNKDHWFIVFLKGVAEFLNNIATEIEKESKETIKKINTKIKEENERYHKKVSQKK